MLIRSRFGRLLMWMGLAAAATYFFDPELGERRRMQLRMMIQQMRVNAERAAAERTADEPNERTRLETTGP